MYPLFNLTIDFLQKNKPIQQNTNVEPLTII